MNIFGGQGAASRAEMEKQQLLMARLDIEMTVKSFNGMIRQCFRKCVPGIQEPDLNVAEMTCIDRCVGKFTRTVKVVTDKMQQQQLQQQQQAQLQQQALAAGEMTPGAPTPGVSQ